MSLQKEDLPDTGNPSEGRGRDSTESRACFPPACSRYPAEGLIVEQAQGKQNRAAVRGPVLIHTGGGGCSPPNTLKPRKPKS